MLNVQPKIFNNISFNSGYNKKETTKMASEKYAKRNADFNPEKCGEFLSRKAAGMPRGIDGIFAASAMYLDGKLNLDDYSSLFTDRSLPVIQKIQFGKNQEMFKEHYAFEITLMRSVLTDISAYKSSEITADEFNEKFENKIGTYCQSRGC